MVIEEPLGLKSILGDIQESSNQVNKKKKDISTKIKSTRNDVDDVDMNSKGGTIRLKLGTLPSYPFVNKSFEVQIFLLDGEKLKCGDEVPLIMSVMIDNDTLEGLSLGERLYAAPASLYSISPNTVIIGKNGIATVNLQFHELSMAFENRKLYITLFIDIKNLPSHLSYLQMVRPTISLGMLCIKHRLIVKAVHDNPQPEIWFKDEGGKDNKIDLNVSLIDSDGQLVLDRQVPLKLFLTYSNGDYVINQEILSLSSDSRLYIDNTGITTLKVRINDISKNHQKQLFSIIVAPDKADTPLLSDISPDSTYPIEVKSKRAKRLRDGSSMPSLLLAPSSSSSKLSVSMYIDAKAIAIDTSQTMMDKPYSSNSPSNIQPEFSSSLGLYSPNTTTVETMSTTDLTGSINSSEGVENVQHFNVALTNTITWITHVLNQCQELKWKIIGYDRLSDGSPDHTKPFYNMCNPNVIFDLLFNEYSQKVNPSLRFLQQVFTNPTMLQIQIEKEFSLLTRTNSGMTTLATHGSTINHTHNHSHNQSHHHPHRSPMLASSSSSGPLSNSSMNSNSMSTSHNNTSSGTMIGMTSSTSSSHKYPYNRSTTSSFYTSDNTTTTANNNNNNSHTMNGGSPRYDDTGGNTNNNNNSNNNSSKKVKQFHDNSHNPSYVMNHQIADLMSQPLQTSTYNMMTSASEMNQQSPYMTSSASPPLSSSSSYITTNNPHMPLNSTSTALMDPHSLSQQIRHDFLTADVMSSSYDSAWPILPTTTWDMTLGSSTHGIHTAGIGSESSRRDSVVSEEDWELLFSDLHNKPDNELKTFYIVAKPYQPHGIYHGFPAYDVERKLIGFYKEGHDDTNDATQIQFTSVTKSNLTEIEIRKLEKYIIHELNQSAKNNTISDENNNSGSTSKTLYKLNNHYNDLDRMKQDVLVNFWLSESNTNDGFLMNG